MTDVLPLPEIISGERFEVRRSAGPNEAYIDLKGRQLVVPFDNDPHAVFVRAHETGHLRWTPLTGKSKVRADVEDRTFQAIEDLRINAGLRASGVRTDAAPPTDPGFEVTALTPEIEVARCVAGLTGRAEGEAYRAAAIREGFARAVEAADEIVREFRAVEAAGKVAPFSMTLRAAERLTDLIAATPTPTPEPDPGEGEKGDSPEGDSPEGDAPEEGGQEGGQEAPGDDGDEAEGDSPGDGDGDEEGDEEGEGGDGDEEGDDAPEGDGDTPGDGDEEGDALKGDEGDEEGDGEGGQGDTPGDTPGDDPAPAPEDRKIANETMSKSWTPGSDGEPVKLPPMTPEEAREILAANFNPDAGTADPAPLREILPPLTQTIKPPKIATARRTTDAGSIPTAMHRFACDMRVFRSSRPGRDGVAVLIDGSASLNLTEEMISSILDECPAAVIAVYAGRVPKDTYGRRLHGRKVTAADDNYGELIVLANGKRRVPSIAPYHWRARGTGNNVVDRPALEWLAARKERRKLWLCDGLVTGAGNEILSPEHTREMARVIRAAKIVRVGSFEDLMSNRAELFNVHRHVTYRAPDGRFAANAARAGGW
jgi:hypothetical protein